MALRAGRCARSVWRKARSVVVSVDAGRVSDDFLGDEEVLFVCSEMWRCVLFRPVAAKVRPLVLQARSDGRG